MPEKQHYKNVRLGFVSSIKFKRAQKCGFDGKNIIPMALHFHKNKMGVETVFG